MHLFLLYSYNMHEAPKLEELGLSPAEARAYVALVGADSRLSAQTVADHARISRSSVYPALKSLADKGLIEGGAGYGGRFAAIPAEEGLPALIEREREMLNDKETLAKELAVSLATSSGNGAVVEKDVVEILRNPRVIADRFDRLQLGANREVDILVKAPVLTTRSGNPVEEEALRRGVRYRCLYEAAVLDNPEVEPYLSRWVAAGEEARVIDETLPLKLALFDRAAALLPLEDRRERHQVTAIIIHHLSLSAGLQVLFDTLWDRAVPMPVPAS